MSEKKQDQPKRPQESDRNLSQSAGYYGYDADGDQPKEYKGRPYFALGAGGAFGGLLGVLLGHLSVVTLFNSYPAAGNWFKGSDGPPFFSLALSTGVYYGCLGAGLFRGTVDRLKGAGIGFAGSFLSFVIPMAVATNTLSFEMITSAPTFSWVYLVLGLYVLAGAIGLWLVGTFCGAGEEWADWRAGFGALGGTALAYMTLQIAAKAIPSLHPATVPGILPHKIALVDGLISGALTGVMIAFTATIRTLPPLKD